MAAKSPSSVSRQSVGDLTLSIITFNGATVGGTVQDIDSGDTYDSYIPSAVAYWAVGNDDPTQNTENIGVNYSEVIAGLNVGRFTFYTSEANRTIILYVLSKT